MYFIRLIVNGRPLYYLMYFVGLIVNGRPLYYLMYFIGLIVNGRPFYSILFHSCTCFYLTLANGTTEAW